MGRRATAEAGGAHDARHAKHALTNIDVARILEEIADLLEIQGGNVFRVRAYRNAARTIETLGVPVSSLVEDNCLDELPGIGSDLAGKICTILKTGTLPLLNELTSKTPESLVQMLRIPGLGPKRAKQIYDTLGVTTLDALENAAKTGRLRALRGIKGITEQKILHGIAALRGHGARWRLAEADAYVQPLLAHLRANPAVERLEVAGSYRRRKETVGDVDILVASSRPKAVVSRFTGYPRVKQIQAEGPTRSSVVLDCGLQVDLRVVPAASFGSALHYFTGSKPHNIAIRAIGLKHGLKINEYGVFRGTRRIGGHTEEEVFKAVGLAWIPPELREAHGEIDAARARRLPRLIALADIRGDLQIHTTATDGVNDLAEMIEAAAARGYEYVAITDHTQAVRVAGGLTRGGFHQQFKQIDRLQTRFPGITILKGAEVDILENGTLDLDESTLAELDVVVAGVHSHFGLSRTAMTRRIVRALGHRHVHILAHPTGRLLGRREPYEIDFAELIHAAADQGVALEINAQSERLDLDDVHARAAHEAGVHLAINTDAHRVEELACMRYGIDQARRAWCEARHVLNALPLTALRSVLRP
ncbi:MAG: DNA polymerase/3'-5' exonuclease PolX [Acidobacteria bacterium]|nr:MAG: DNA polymerase/3'-5' exonuclease PolX [Acidobacteriota bacterium]